MVNSTGIFRQLAMPNSGTSMAAPVVSGAAAVLKGAFPNLTARQVVDILLRTATDLGAPGTDPVYGRGLVNLARALQPIGPTRAAAADAFGIAPTADTRVALSAAFGDAAPSANIIPAVLIRWGGSSLLASGPGDARPAPCRHAGAAAPKFWCVADRMM